MNALKEFYGNNKRYIGAAIVGFLAGLSHLGYRVPEWVSLALVAAGLN